MTGSGKIYYLAAALAALAAIITAVKGGLTSDETFHFGFLLLMAAILAWLGTRQKKPEA